MATDTEPIVDSETRYAAFISYRHVEPDRKWAKWLHRALETYRVPNGLRVSHGLPARVGRVFRDEEELSASPDLSKEIEEALRQSGHLIVVCSPRTPKSEWVNQEVVRFRETGRGNRILALLIEGEPGESFPASLREIRRKAVEEGGRVDGSVEATEPLAADVRPAGHETRGHIRQVAKQRLLSTILGCRFDDLRRRELQRQRRQRVAWISALVVLVIVLAGLVVLAVSKQQEAGASAAIARKERDKVLRLSDSKIARDLALEAETLWPIRSDRADAMADWVDRARELVEQRGTHESRLDELRMGGIDTTEHAWQEDVLTDLLADLERLVPTKGDGGLVAEVMVRHERAATMRRVSIEDQEEAWGKTIEGIAASATFDGFRITPQEGLIPLGPDPDTELYEFAHVGSGSVPARDPKTERLVLEQDAAIVLVLIPAGTFRMGAQKLDPQAANYDPGARDDESNEKSQVVEVVLSAPFFLAKHECTQAQWQRLTGGANPSLYAAGVDKKWVVTPRHPVEQVSWRDSDRWLRRWNLSLPTEAMWEYACRAGTDTPWYTGREAASLQGHANIADAYCKANGGYSSWVYTTEVDDGHTVHAAVGTYRPNAFGLHDLHGNVFEWCRDIYGPYSDEPMTDPVREEGSDKVVGRGGTWDGPAGYARSAARAWTGPGDRNGGVGFRAARDVTTD